MLAFLPDKGPLASGIPVVSLIPKSGLQFLDFGFDINKYRVSRSFFYQASQDGGTELICLSQNSNMASAADHQTQGVNDTETYSFNGMRAIEAYLDMWVPLPFFHCREKQSNGQYVFDIGPSNWVRIYITTLAESDKFGNTHRGVLAFDTNLMTHRDGQAYLAPSPSDVQARREFCLAPEAPENAWFRKEPWVAEWLVEVYRTARVKRGGTRNPRAQEFPSSGEPEMLYLTLLALLASVPGIPRIRFVDTVSLPNRFAPISVDLMLDVGNSRTCGILVESSRDERVTLDNSYPLELRDLTRPYFVYSEPFPSRLEFAQASFGIDRLSRRSRRSNAFAWPTVARVGEEAAYLSYFSQGIEGSTGLPGIKRYLWDTTPRNHEWRFNRGPTLQIDAEEPVTAGAFVGYVREDGEERQGGDLPPLSARFSRSSLMSFYLSEIFLQAFVLVNSLAKRYGRAHAEIPRRLHRIILTMPTAMPLPERRLLEKRVKTAQKIVWRLLGLEDEEPEVILQWDEATGTQVVFLYNEVTTNFLGDLKTFFDVCGRVRQEIQDKPLLRIASIDIGGGTTDLIITRYELEGSTAVKPIQEYREGFNIAGDDILCSIIERHVLQSLFEAIQAAGVTDPAPLLANLLGENFGGQTEIDRTLRKQFANQIALPIGLRLINAYEAFDPKRTNSIISYTFRDLFSSVTWPSERVIAYLEDAVKDAGGRDFTLANVRFEVPLAALDYTVRRTIGPVLRDLCEIVYLFDCDYLLLSGRSCRMPAIHGMVLATLPVPANRIQTMHRYKVGSWYPFRDALGRLADPKTTAAVGAMVCALAEGYLESFHLRSRDLVMKSTARFIGEMEPAGQIKPGKLFFAGVDLEDRRRPVQRRTFDFYTPVFIGFRQVEAERWPATPLYHVEFAQPQEARRRALPLCVTIERLSEDEDPHFKLFEVAEVTDGDGMPLPKQTVVLRLQTLKDEYGYWVDSGIFSTPR